MLKLGQVSGHFERLLVVSPCSNADWRERRPASANPTAFGNDGCSGQASFQPTSSVAERSTFGDDFSFGFA
ncbi:hypothetical protein ABTC30_19575, partial [Acinetobacter baumannii]